MKSNYKMIVLGLFLLFLIIYVPIFSESIIAQNAPETIFNSVISGIIIGFISSIIAAIVITKYQYFICFNRLCSEINDNYKKMLREKIDDQYLGMRLKAEQILSTGNWIGFDKIISVFIITFSSKSINQDQYRYLSNNEFRNFVNGGFFTNVEYNIIHPLTLFYFYCDGFSIKEQDCEKPINYNWRGKDQAEIIEWTEITIREIDAFYRSYAPIIENNYNAISHYFQKIRLFEIEKWLLT